MAYHVEKKYMFLDSTFDLSRNNHSMQCNTTHGNACTGAALIREEKETYKGR